MVQIIDPVRDGLADGIQLEVMVVDVFHVPAPTQASILKVANQFFLLGIHADHWPTIIQKELLLGFHVLKLPVSIRVLRTCQPLDVGFERVTHFLQQAPHGPGTARWSFTFNWPLKCRKLLRTHFCPFIGLPAVSGSTSSCKSASIAGFFSTGGRPAPAKRTRSDGRSARSCSNSCCPRRTGRSSNTPRICSGVCSVRLLSTKVRLEGGAGTYQAFST